MKKQLEALISELIERGVLLDQARDEFEKKVIATALGKTQGNQTRAAKLLDISRDALRYKMKKFQLQESGTH